MSDPYEAPEKTDLILDAGYGTVKERVIQLIGASGFLG